MFKFGIVLFGLTLHFCRFPVLAPEPFTQDPNACTTVQPVAIFPPVAADPFVVDVPAVLNRGIPSRLNAPERFLRNLALRKSDGDIYKAWRLIARDFGAKIATHHRHPELDTAEGVASVRELAKSRAGNDRRIARQIITREFGATLADCIMDSDPEVDAKRPVLSRWGAR